MLLRWHRKTVGQAARCPPGPQPRRVASLIGETIAHFRLLEKLGQGGMGAVYRAVDLNLDRPVAIKVLPPESQQDEASVGRFLREAKTASKLRHPAITTIHEFGLDGDRRYLAMEFVEGKTLRSMLDKGPLSVAQALDITAQVADALTEAEDKSVIHRDIKPENLMVTPQGQAKVLDFSLAKVVHSSDSATHSTFKTGLGLVMGTIAYMSPEQALDAELDCRTDIYSLGVVLYEMVTGELPFTAASPSVVLAKILNQAPPALSGYDLPACAGLQRVIHKALNKDRGQRYQRAAELLADVRALQREVESSPHARAAMRAARAEQKPRARVTEADLDSLVSGAMQAAKPTVVAALEEPEHRPVEATGASPAPAPAVSEAAASAQPAPSRCHAAAVVHVLNLLVTAAAALYAAACLMVFALPLFRTGSTDNLLVVRGLHRTVDPLPAFISDIAAFNLTSGGFNFLLVLIAIAIYVLGRVARWRLLVLERRLRNFTLPAESENGQAVDVESAGKARAGARR